ncbi:hypothetical protein GCM10022600_09790 [Qipengyuania pelagi]
MIAAIAFTGLTVNRSGRPSVHDVSAAISPASWFGMIGANGSGRTTLLRAMAGRLPIGAGSCAILGEEQAHDRSARARAVGFAPPIEHLPTLLKVRELLSLAGDPAAFQQERSAGL